MPSQDYSFDPTASNPDNLITLEVHPLVGTVAVIPLQGAFYREGLVVEGIMEMGVNDIIETLRPDLDYLFSPLFIRPSAVAGKDAYSYILLKGEWDRVKISYQCVGGEHGIDRDLLTKISELSFDRTKIAKWLEITGTDSYNPRSRNPVLAEASELEILNAGMQRINEALERLTPSNGEKATNQQVTTLEIRQSALETIQGNISIEFDGIQSNFTDIRELFTYLEALVLRGKNTNITNNGGFVYHSETVTNTHVIVHGLDTTDIDATVWVFDDISKTYYHSTLIENSIVDNNTITLVSDTPVDLLVVVRPVSVADGGFIYESTLEETTHFIQHNLSSGFISGNVWVDDGNGGWVWAVVPLRIIDNNRVVVELTEARKVRVVLQKPLPNAFIYKSPSAAQNHRVTHDLYTPQVGVYVWEQNPDGTYSTALPSTSITAPNVIDVVLDSPRIIKVVVQPALVLEPSFEQEYDQKHTLLEDRMDQLQNLFYNLEQLLQDIRDNGGGTGTLLDFRYESAVPALVHVITHSLDSNAVDVTLWVQHTDGSYHNDDAKISMLDDNTIRVTLTEPAMIRARIM